MTVQTTVAKRQWGHGAGSTGISLGVLCTVTCLLIGGCVKDRPLPASRSATAMADERAKPAYWYDQPATTTATALDFDRLWAAADRAARDYRFGIDRTDYRAGVMTTTPMVSRQLFEVWRADVTPIDEQAQSTLGTVRRTARFEFRRNDDGTYAVAPKVLVERYAMPQRRVTAVYRYGQAISPAEQGETRDGDGEVVPSDYWYAIGRDADAERKLARSIESKLRRG